MENMNIQAYKDGNDLILVFKNVDTSLESLVLSMLSNVTTKDVPALNDPISEPMVKPENFDNCESVIPEFLSNDYTETQENTEETIEEKVKAIEEDPIEIHNVVEYVVLLSRVKQGLVKDIDACTKLLKNFKDLNKDQFGKTMGSNLEKDALTTILIEINKIVPEAVAKKTKGLSINEYLEKVKITDLRYDIRGLMWYNVKL